jgi:hypothetical protein
VTNVALPIFTLAPWIIGNASEQALHSRRYVTDSFQQAFDAPQQTRGDQTFEDHADGARGERRLHDGKLVVSGITSVIGRTAVRNPLCKALRRSIINASGQIVVQE